MMVAAFDPKNPYDYKGPTVSGRINKLISQDSALMRQARTQGLQQANRRGLLNSTIAVGSAQDSVVRAAMPIASQEAAEANDRWKASQGLFGQRKSVASQERIARMNIDASRQEKAGAAATALESVYSNSFNAIMENPELPANVREQYLAHIGRVRDSSMGLVEQLYGINLKWKTPTLPKPQGPSPEKVADKAKAKASSDWQAAQEMREKYG